MLQLDRNSFCSEVALDSNIMAFKDDDSILDILAYKWKVNIFGFFNDYLNCLQQYTKMCIKVAIKLNKFISSLV